MAGSTRTIVATGTKHHDTRGRQMTLWAAVLGSSVAMIDMTVINVALPAIGQGLGTNAVGLQWTVNAFMLPLSTLVLIGGSLADTAGRKRIFIIGLVLFTVASLACALAPSFAWLILGRVGQGIGASLLSPASLAILGSDFDGDDRAKAIGTWAAASAVAIAAGPIIGGWLVDAFGWRWMFALVLPPAFAAFVLAKLGIRDGGNSATQKPDWIGGILATIGLVLIVGSLTLMASGGAQRYTFLFAACVPAALFLLWERRLGDRAMVPPALFGTTCFAALTVLTFLLYAALSGILLLLPYLLISTGWPAAMAGMALLPLPVIMAAGSRVSGGLSDRIGARWMLTAGSTVTGIGLGLMYMIPANRIEFVRDVLPPMTFVGVGMTMAVAPLTTAVMAAVDPHHSGAAAGFNSATARIGGLIAVSLIGFALKDGGRNVSIGAFHSAALVAASVALLAAVAAWISGARTSV